MHPLFPKRITIYAGNPESAMLMTENNKPDMAYRHTDFGSIRSGATSFADTAQVNLNLEYGMLIIQAVVFICFYVVNP